MRITAIYRHSVGGTTFAAYFEIETFRTNGVDCDTPDILARLMGGFRAEVRERAKAFEVAAGANHNHGIDPAEGCRVLAFYTDRRAKALMERWDAPIIA